MSFPIENILTMSAETWLSGQDGFMNSLKNYNVVGVHSDIGLDSFANNVPESAVVVTDYRFSVGRHYRGSGVALIPKEKRDKAKATSYINK